jgi:hypothetical protein
MPRKAKTTDLNNDIGLRIQELEDEQLKDVLKKRKLYQEQAADAAISEAIRRDIISSEEDLHDPDYRHEPLKPKLFPVIENPKNKNNIRKSVSRGLLLAGLLPTVWGMVRLNAGFTGEGMLLLVYGVLWMGFSASLIRRFSMTAIRFLFAFAALSAAYIIRWLVITPQIVFMDLFIVIVLYALMAYGLFFILRLKE